MIAEDAYIAYFTGLCQKHKVILHDPETRKAFFYIPVEMDLKEMDNAIKGDISSPMMGLDALRGAFDDGGTASNRQIIEGQFFILDKVNRGEQESIRAAQKNCLQIGLEVLARMYVDFKRNPPFTDGATFTIKNVQYDPVGPMATKYYGYTFRFTISCPFGFTVDSAIWSDK